jgi:hypothetical protein
MIRRKFVKLHELLFASFGIIMAAAFRLENGSQSEQIHSSAGFRLTGGSPDSLAIVNVGDIKA